MGLFPYWVVEFEYHAAVIYLNIADIQSDLALIECTYNVVIIKKYIWSQQMIELFLFSFA